MSLVPIRLYTGDADGPRGIRWRARRALPRRRHTGRRARCRRSSPSRRSAGASSRLGACPPTPRPLARCASFDDITSLFRGGDAIRGRDANLGSDGLRYQRRTGADRPPRRREPRRYHGQVSAARLRPRPATATRPRPARERDRSPDANHISRAQPFLTSQPPRAIPRSRPEPTAPARTFPAPRTR